MSPQLIASLLTAVGVKIDPAEITKAWESSKDALPKLLVAFNQLAEQQKLTNERLLKIEQILCEKSTVQNWHAQQIDTGSTPPQRMTVTFNGNSIP